MCPVAKQLKKTKSVVKIIELTPTANHQIGKKSTWGKEFRCEQRGGWSLLISHQTIKTPHEKKQAGVDHANRLDNFKN